MTLKQLAERLDIQPNEIDFELVKPCKNCEKMGGNDEPCAYWTVDRVCRIKVSFSTVRQ